MPRAVDPALIGRGLPISHSPLNRIGYRVLDKPFNFAEFLASIQAQWPDWVRDHLLDIIKDLTGIDLSGLAELVGTLLPGLDGFFPRTANLVEALTGLLGGTDLSAVETLFTNLLHALDADLTELNLPTGTFDPTAMITRLISNRIVPQGLLAQLAGGVLPDSQKPQWLQDATDNIHNAYANLGNPVDVNQDVTSVLSAIFGINRTALSASSQSSMLSARVRALESAANAIVINFAGASSSSMPGGWSAAFTGAGSGSMGPDGNGNLIWHPFGILARTEIARYTVMPLPSDNGVIEAVLSSSPQSPLFAEGYTYLNFRMDTAGTTYTRLRIGYSAMQMQTVIAGAVANIGPSAGIGAVAGDLVRVAFGDAAGANPRHFVITRNGTLAPGLDFTGPGTAPVGAAQRYVGAGMTSDTRLITGQVVPAGIAAITALETL